MPWGPELLLVPPKQPLHPKLHLGSCGSKMSRIVLSGGGGAGGGAGPTQSGMFHSPRDFEHLLLRAFAHCMWDRIMVPLRCQAQWLNSNQKSEASVCCLSSHSKLASRFTFPELRGN